MHNFYIGPTLMCNDWMNAFIDKKMKLKYVKTEKVLNNLDQLR